MHLWPAAGVGILLLGLAVPAAGQQRETAPPRGETVDVSRLPLNLERIQRELRQSTSTVETTDGLNLRYQVEVFGQAPDIILFTPEDNLRNGPVPYGAPTHRQIIEHITPQEFRSPVMDFNALIRWLAEKAR